MLEMKVYTLKITLRGVSPMVWRRLHIPGITSLATLHEAIQIVNGWDNENLHRFHIYAVDYGINYLGGCSFRGNAHKILLDDFEFSAGDKFFYEYNFFEHNIVDIRVEAVEEERTDNTEIYCLKGNGVPGIDKRDVVNAKYELLEAITKVNAKTTVGDLLPYVEALRATRFDRQQMNQTLKTQLSSQDNL